MGGVLATLALAGFASWSGLERNASADEGPGPCYWHAVGSTGTIDESDLNEYRAASGRLMFKGGKQGRIISRYDVDIFNYPLFNITQANLFVRYRDNGPDARVIVKLKSYNIDTGATDTLLVFDSDDWPQMDSYQKSPNIGAHNPDFQHDWDTAYWLEATLYRSSESGRPELGSLTYTVEGS